MRDPYASTWTGSRIVTVARPLRTPASSCLTWSIAVFIRLLTSPNRPFRSLTSIADTSRRDERADGLADDGAPDVPRRPQVEDDDRQAIVHAERDRGRVHHLQALLEDLQVRDAIESRRSRLDHRIRVVNAVDLCRLENDVRLDFHRAQRGGGVGAE